MKKYCKSCEFSEKGVQIKYDPTLETPESLGKTEWGRVSSMCHSTIYLLP